MPATHTETKCSEENIIIIKDARLPDQRAGTHAILLQIPAGEIQGKDPAGPAQGWQRAHQEVSYLARDRW